MNTKVMGKYDMWITDLQKTARADSRVVGMIIYGSYLNSPVYEDVDIALFLDPGLPRSKMGQVRIEYLKLAPDQFDIQIFNLLPVAIQFEILQGKVVFTQPTAYELAYKSVQEYEDFARYREQYLEVIMHESAH